MNLFELRFATRTNEQNEESGRVKKKNERHVCQEKDLEFYMPRFTKKGKVKSRECA